MPQRIIFHVDMDALYAAIKVNDQQELAGKFLIEGWPFASWRPVHQS